MGGRLLVEENKLNHERPSELELQPIMPSTSRDRERRRGARPRLPRGMTAILVVVGLLVVVAILGAIGGGSSPHKPKPNRGAAPVHKPSTTPPAGATGPAAAAPTSR